MSTPTTFGGSIYGVQFYGTTTYGAPLFLEFDARPFTATPRGYGVLDLNWVNPTGDWDLLRLVRSSYGYPKFPDDGTLLWEKGTEALTNYEDRAVKEGRFFYYSVFVRDVGTGAWVRAGDVIGLPVEDHGYGKRLFELMPGFMQEADAERTTEALPDGPLRRYLDVLGITFDHLRTEYETLRWLRDPERISGNLLGPLSEMYGVPFEPAIGMRQIRVWTRDAVYLYRSKGTRPGVEAAASAMTGWGARVTYGKNRVRSDGAHAWYTYGNDDILIDEASPDDPGIMALRFHPDLVDSGERVLSSAPLPLPEPLPRWYGLRVRPGHDYTVSCQIRRPSGDSAEWGWTVSWFTEEGELVSGSSSPGIDVPMEEWTPVTYSLPAPMTAAYAVITLEWRSGSAVAPYIRWIQLEQGLGATSFEPARSVIINFDPARWNFMYNPSFENALYGWRLGASSWATTGNPSNSVGVTNSTAMSLRGEVTSFRLGLATPGSPHIFSIYARGEGQVGLVLKFFSDEDPESDPLSWYSETFDSVDENQRFSVGGTAPVDALFAEITVVSVPADPEGSILFDDSLFEEGQAPGDYFDGSFFGADFLWAGTPGISASKYYPARTERNVRARELLPHFLPIDQSFTINYIGGAPLTAGGTVTGDEGTLGSGTFGVMPFGE